MKKLLIPTLLLSSAAIVGCSRGEPTEQDYDDVALAVGTMVAGSSSDGEVAEMADAIVMSQGDTPTGLTRSGSGDLQGTRGSLTYDFSVSCLDVTGAAQEQCDENTDMSRVVVDWSGQVDWPRYDATVNRTGDWMLSNIQSGVARFEGQGTFDISSEFLSLDGNRMRTFQLSYAADYDSILIDTATKAIQGGTASYEIAAQRTASNRFRDVDAEFDISATVTFASDGTAVLELDGNRSYNIELASGAVTRR